LGELASVRSRSDSTLTLLAVYVYVEPVCPATATSPMPSTAMPAPASPPLPPNSVLYQRSLPCVLSLVTKASVAVSAPLTAPLKPCSEPGAGKSAELALPVM